MSTDTTTALAVLANPPSSDASIEDLAAAVLDRLAHEHPQPGGGEDLFCLNLTSYMGERMGNVLTRLRDAEAEQARLRHHRSELITLHEREELLFGGFICLHCTPADADDPDDNVYWPCPSLRAVGMTDEEAIALITAHRAAIAEKARLEAGANGGAV
ncbi:hypothetical protein GCM10017559_07940 [Streptosporangium longisporum]|uniref:Uncharacterized protein n=1 Tax=Streptosporangium longisporum TaxID=46187 RepID=A0ABP6KBH2_9ACTN